MAKKLRICCRECGYTWYPDKQKWESNPEAAEPDCPNADCKLYGTGMHSISNGSIWQIKGTVNPC